MILHYTIRVIWYKSDKSLTSRKTREPMFLMTTIPTILVLPTKFKLHQGKDCLSLFLSSTNTV